MNRCDIQQYDIQGRYKIIKVEKFEDTEDEYDDCYNKTKTDCFFDDTIRDKCKLTCAQYNIKSKLITGPDQKFAKLVDDIDCSKEKCKNDIIDCKIITADDCSSNINVRKTCTSICMEIYPEGNDYDCINASKQDCYFNDDTRKDCFSTCNTFYPDMNKFNFDLNNGPDQKFAKLANEPEMLLCQNDYMFCNNRNIDCNNIYFKSVCRKKCTLSCNDNK